MDAYNIYIKLYKTLNDETEGKAELSLAINGYCDLEEDEMHEVNKSFIEEAMHYGVKKENILEYVPEAIIYFEED